MKILFLDSDRQNRETFKSKNPNHDVLFCYEADIAIKAISTYDYDICFFNINAGLAKLTKWLTKDLADRKRPYYTLFIFHNEDRAASYALADSMFDRGYYVVIKPGAAKENCDNLKSALPPTKGMK